MQALAVDKNGTVYAATNPDGKVKKIERSNGERGKREIGEGEKQFKWISSVYFDPGTKYIWDLAFDSSGNLYVATGDRGEIYRVSPQGEHSVFFTSDEAHIRVLAFDGKGNLIAGSDGSGLVYRIAPSGEGFVLYSAPKKEITALAIDTAGNIYAAGVGEKRSGRPSILHMMPTPAPGMTPSTNLHRELPLLSGANYCAGGRSFPAPGTGAAGGSEIYRIAPDGSPMRVWTSREDLVYALAFDPEEAAGGNRESRARFCDSRRRCLSDLLKASATRSLPWPERRTAACTPPRAI